MICPSDTNSGFPAQTRLDAVKYTYRSKEEADLPFTLNVFNSKKQSKNIITLELEANTSCNLNFKGFERITVAMNLGDGAVDIDVLKKGNHEVEQDQGNNQLLWHVTNIMEEGSAVLSFASEKLSFEDIFPIDVKFDETYSLIDMKVESI